jgi:hypothetical protein
MTIRSWLSMRAGGWSGYDHVSRFTFHVPTHPKQDVWSTRTLLLFTIP